MDSRIGLVKNALLFVDNFPISGIKFVDVMPLVRNPTIFNATIDCCVEKIHRHELEFDYIAGLEARGFLFGPTIAQRMGCGFLPIRKKGKLPGKVLSCNSTKEYGQDILEIQAYPDLNGMKVLIFDDLIATGGSVAATERLLHEAGAKSVGLLTIVELSHLHPNTIISSPIFPLLTYEELLE